MLEGVRSKNLQATIFFVDFIKALDSIHRGKMEQILLAYGQPKETVAAIMMLYRNNKVKVRSPDGDTDYFDIVEGVLQGDTLAPYLFIICLDYVLRTSIDKIKENGFKLRKKQKIPRKNNYRRWLRRWNRTSGKCTRPSRNSAITLECCEQYWTSPGGSTSQNSNCTATDHSSRKLSKLDEPDTRDTAGELVSDVLLWTPSHGRTKAGRPARNYIKQLCADTGCSPEDLPKAMDYREVLREWVRNIRADSVTWWWWWWWWWLMWTWEKSQSTDSTVSRPLEQEPQYRMQFNFISSDHFLQWISFINSRTDKIDR